MKWNLKAHILDHSAAVHNTLGSKRKFDENDKANQHYTISIDRAQMITKGYNTQQDIDTKMIEIMNDLKAFHENFHEIKGHTKKGTVLYRDVKFNMTDDTLLAYHSAGSDHVNSNLYEPNPHFHFLAHKSKKLGGSWKYLRTAISTVSTKHGLVFHLEEESNNPKNKVNREKIKRVSWYPKRASDKSFAKAFHSGWIKKSLDYLEEHYKTTNNLQHYIKVSRDYETRLKRQGINHDFKFPLYLSDEQKATIRALYNANKDEIINLINQRENLIARSYLEHINGFDSIIINEIERTGIKMPVINIDINELDLHIKRKFKVDKSDKFKKTLTYAYIQDLNHALKYAKSEGEVPIFMQRLGYEDWKWKAKNQSGSRHRVGFAFKRNGKTTTAYFNQLGMSMLNIRAALVENSKNKSLVVPTDLISHFKVYEPPKHVSYASKKFEEIYDLKSSLDLKGFFVRELHSKAVEFKAKKTFIVDNGNQISVRVQRAEDLERNVQIIADMVEGKAIQRYNITGSEPFKIAMRAELNRREQQRAAKVDEVQDELTPTEQSDDDVLRELSDMHLSKHSIEDRPAEYRQLFKIRSTALLEKDINLLLKTYAILPTIDNSEQREKLISMAKCLGISFKQITNEIALENGITENEFDAFRDTIKQMEGYDSIYLNKFVQRLKDGLNGALLLNESLSDNHLERNIRLMEKLSSELDDFQAAHLSKKEYIRRIEDIEEALASDNFYEVQSLMDGLKQGDKQVVEYRLSERIDLAAAKLDFDQLKRSLERDMNNIALLDNELPVNHHKPTQELY